MYEGRDRKGERVKDVEAIYDEQVAPLMAQIIAICKEHGVPMVATFQLNDGNADDPEGDGVGPLCCTTAILPEGCDPKLVDAYRVMKNGWQAVPSMFAMTVTTKGAKR